MAVSGTTSTSGTSSSATSDSTVQGFASLTATDFLKLLIEELKNQDPTDPMKSSELLQQISSMRTLQADTELSSTLKSLTSTQQVSAGSSFLGGYVTGVNTKNESVSGVADRVFLRDGETYLGVGDNEVALAKVESVALLAPETDED